VECVLFGKIIKELKSDFRDDLHLIKSVSTPNPSSDGLKSGIQEDIHLIKSVDKSDSITNATHL